MLKFKIQVLLDVFHTQFLGISNELRENAHETGTSYYLPVDSSLRLNARLDMGEFVTPVWSL